MTGQQPTRFLKIALVLFLLAAGVATYMVWNHYAVVNGEIGFGSFCSINQTFDCDAVNASEYSDFLGIPLATWALSYYLLAMILVAVAIRNAFARREALMGLLGLATVSLVATAGTLFIMFVVLKKLCVMCLSLHTLDVATWVLIWLSWREYTGQKSIREEWKIAVRRRLGTFAITGAVLLGLVHLVSMQMKRNIPFDAAAFAAEFRAAQPQVVETGDAARKGFTGANPPVQIVEFADFQCPSCGFAARFMHRLLKMYPDKLQLAFKNYPLSSECNPNVPRRMHESACLAAKMAICANQQGKFDIVFEKFFSSQKDINPEKLNEWVAQLGLDKKAVDDCVAAPETAAQLQKEIDQGKSLGLEATPTFFINGRKVEGPIDENRMKVILKELGQ